MIRTRKNIRRAISSNDQRGMMLVLCVALIPISMMAMLLALTRFEIGLREAQREQGRVQARLLAESALALYQAQGGAAIQGELEGFGAYEAAIKNGMIEASGVAPGNHLQAVCFIKAETPQGDGPLRIVGFENRIEVRE